MAITVRGGNFTGNKVGGIRIGPGVDAELVNVNSSDNDGPGLWAEGVPPPIPADLLEEIRAAALEDMPPKQAVATFGDRLKQHGILLEKLLSGGASLIKVVDWLQSAL